MNNENRLKLWMAIFVFGVGISSIGDFIYLVAINVFVLDATHSAVPVAGLWVLSRMAGLLVGPWVGSVTDRFSRRTQLIIVELCRAALLGVLPLSSHLVWIYGVLFLLGICSTFFGSLFLPYQTLLIPESSRKRVNAVTSTLKYSAFLIGPAIAGMLLLRGTVALPLWLDAASFLFSAISFMLLPDLQSGVILDTPTVGNSRNPWHVVRRDWREALLFLRRNTLFTLLFSLEAIVGLFALTADAQEVVFARQALHLGKLGFGLMVTAAGIGFLLGSLAVSFLAKRLKVSALMGFGHVFGAFGYLVYSLAHGFWWAVTGLIVLGTFGSFAGVGYTTYTQQAMPISHMGRINSVTGPPRQLLSIVLILLGGALASWLGVRSVMISMAVLMSLAALMMAAVLWLPGNRDRIADSGF